MQVKFKCMPDHLLATMTGEYELMQAIDSFRRGLGHCKANGYNNFLVDCRDSSAAKYATEKALYTLEVLDLYRKYVNGINREIRVAYLADPEHLSTFEPSHDLANIFGLPVNTFTSPEETEAWLGITIEK